MSSPVSCATRRRSPLARSGRRLCPRTAPWCASAPSVSARRVSICQARPTPSTAHPAGAPCQARIPVTADERPVVLSRRWAPTAAWPGTRQAFSVCRRRRERRGGHKLRPAPAGHAAQGRAERARPRLPRGRERRRRRHDEREPHGSFGHVPARKEFSPQVQCIRGPRFSARRRVAANQK